MMVDGGGGDTGGDFVEMLTTVLIILGMMTIIAVTKMTF